MNPNCLITSLLLCQCAVSFPFSHLRVPEQFDVSRVYYLSEPDDTNTSIIDFGTQFSNFSSDNNIQLQTPILPANSASFLPNGSFSTYYFQHLKDKYPKKCRRYLWFHCYVDASFLL